MDKAPRTTPDIAGSQQMLDIKDDWKCTTGKNWAEKVVFQSVWSWEKKVFKCEMEWCMQGIIKYFCIVKLKVARGRKSEQKAERGTRIQLERVLEASVPGQGIMIIR